MASENQPKRLPQYIAALSVCMGAVATGAIFAWVASIGVDMQNNGYNGIPVDSGVLGLVGSCATLGALFMSFIIGYICDLVGRKYALILMAIPLMLGWILVIFASHVVMLYIGRFLSGTGGGAFSVGGPLYTSEIAQKEIRGALGSYYQLLLTFGILIAYFTGYVLPIKVYTIFCSIFPIIFAIAFFFQPESPKYLLLRNKNDKAKKALTKLRGKQYNVDGELAEIRAQIQHDIDTKVPFLQSFKKPNIKKSLFLSFSIMFFQQMCGITAVTFYTSNIFESAGGTIKPEIGTIIIGLLQFVATLLSTLLVDKLGRKLLLILSGGLMALSGTMLGLFFTFQEREIISKETVEKIGFLPVLSLSIFVIVFSLGFGPIPWMISGEIYAPEIKSKASSAAGSFNWFLSFMISKFYFDVKEALGGDITFYIFSAFSLGSVIFVYFLVPETKGKSLEEIQKELAGEKP